MITPSPYLIPGLPQKRVEVISQKHKNTANAIISTIAAHYGYDVAVIKDGKRLSDKASYVRQWCVWFILAETKCSLSVIGKLLGGRDHATIIHARDKVKAQVFSKVENEYKNDHQVIYSLVERLKKNGIANADAIPVLPKFKRKCRPKTEEPVFKIFTLGERPKAKYTNTNYSEQLEERAKALAI